MPLKTLYSVLLIFCFHFSNAQQLPSLKQQIPLSQVSSAITAPGGHTIMVKSLNNNYTLIDQSSKIQLGTIQLDIGSLGLPGQALSYMQDDYSFIVSTGEELLHVNFLNNQIDTVFNQRKFPEFIVNYIPSPGNKDELLIALKKYPVDKKGSVAFFKADAKNNSVYDDTRDCRIILFNTKTKTIVRSLPIAFAITVFAEKNGSVIAGTFDGDILEIDSLLAYKKIFHAFDAPVHSLAGKSGWIVTVPHIGPKYIGDNGDEYLLFYNESTRQLKKISPARQVPPPQDGNTFKIGPSAAIKKIFSRPGQLLVAYGFNGLLNISVNNFDTSSWQTGFGAADFYCFNRDSTRLVTAVAGTPGIFNVSGDLVMFNFSRQQSESIFRKSSGQEKYHAIYKLFDRDGNYHNIALRRNLFSPDTLVIYSSNRSAPSFIQGGNDAFVIDEKDTAIGIQEGGRLVFGKLHLENLNERFYSFVLNSDAAYHKDTIPPYLFEQIYDSKKYASTEIPYGIKTVQPAGRNAYLVTGYTPSSTKTLQRLIVIDSAGKTLFKPADYDEGLVFQDPCLSPSGKYLAYYWDKGKTNALEVWDWKQNKKIFSQSFSGDYEAYSYCFDKTKDIFWYGKETLGSNTEVYKVDISEAVPQAKSVFHDATVLSFKIDMSHDLVASEGYSQLQLHRLSDHKLLWRGFPFSNGFTVHHLPEGFSFTSETESYVITGRKDRIYFTSYQPFRPIEVLNEYLYRGEKTSMNNLAFVLNGKGYLPADFDIYFNRPDSVIQRSGSSNVAFNELMGKTVLKRTSYYPVKDIGSVLQNAPTVTINGKDKIPEQVGLAQFNLSINATANGTDPINILQVTDNGIPVFASPGLLLRNRAATIDTTIVVPLVKGLNRLQVSATTTDGYVSAPEYLSITADIPSPTPRTWFVGIGVSQYRDSSMNLVYADKDARDLSRAFASKYPNASIDTFINEGATASAVLAISKKLMQTGIEDLVVISLSGHGLIDSAGNFYFAMHDMDFKHPAVKGLRYEDIENLLARIPARKKLLWIDACHSGQLDKNIALENSDKKATDGSEKGAIITTTASGITLQNSFELMQELFADVGVNDGTVVISAAGGLQSALENTAWENGAFTYCIKKGLLEKQADANRDGNISVNELKEFVSRSVEELTGGKQKPTSRRELLEYDWKLW